MSARREHFTSTVWAPFPIPLRVLLEDDRRDHGDERALRRLIADHLGVTEALVVDAVRFSDLGADSLDMLSLLIGVERRFGLKLSEAEAEACATVGNALALVGRAVASKDEAALAPSSPNQPIWECKRAPRRDC